MNQQKKLLVIGFVWPEPNSSAAGTRLMQIMDCFKDQGFAVVFASTASDSDFMVSLDDFSIQKQPIVLNDSSFDTFVSDLQPSVVLFDRFMTEEQFGWRVAKNCPNALRILDTEDLHALRLARQKAFKEKKKFSIQSLLAEEVAKREIASILRCDLSIMISKYEMKVLQEVFKIEARLLFYMPFIFDIKKETSLGFLPEFEDRKDFVFIGNFLHEPNWNAVQFLKETIWPLIRKKMPTAVLTVYGAYPTQKVLQLHHANEGFLIKGRANSAKEVIENARVLLAPIRFGAGLKGKLVEAMLYGTPTVTTAIGAEAMHDDFDWNGVIEDNPEAFSQAAIALYSDKNKWQEAQKNGLVILNNCYQSTPFITAFNDRIHFLMHNLSQHRLHNFMGGMLLHHQLLSTKYMSKWIEEKNKKV